MGVSSTSEGRGPGGREVRAALVRAVASADTPDAAVDAVVGLLASGEVAELLVQAAADVQSLAWSAWSLRDDLYDDPRTPETAARLVLSAVADAAGAPPPPCAITRAEAAAAAATVAYRGWRFSIVEDPLGLHVRVEATFEDTRKPGRTFAVSRAAPIHGRDVAAAALVAALQVERHEAMERFLVDGRRSFDPHSPPARFVADDIIRKR